jgi:formylglycine-generating enzyme required for sulfatase activity
VGKFPVVFEEYDLFCEEAGHGKPKDSGFGRRKHPVINVSWMDAVRFCNWKSGKDQLKMAYDNKGQLINESGEVTRNIKSVEGWRLLTDAEWEYTARGGHKNVQETLFAGTNNVKDVAVFKSRRTREVGFLKPNEIGVYDMCGNVSEWCYDYYDQRFFEHCDENNPIDFESSPNRVIRGGNWKSDEFGVMVTKRDYFSVGKSEKKKNTIGFRIARTINDPEQEEFNQLLVNQNSGFVQEHRAISDPMPVNTGENSDEKDSSKKIPRRKFLHELKNVLISFREPYIKHIDNYVSPMDNMVLIKGGTSELNYLNLEEVISAKKSGYDIFNFKHKYAVEFDYDFYVNKYPVTFDEYEVFCDATNIKYPDDYGYGRGQKPVIGITWSEAVDYCNWLSEKEGLEPAHHSICFSKGQTNVTKLNGYRLLTSAEWEYSAKGGRANKNDLLYAGGNNLMDLGWYSENSQKKFKNQPQKVGLKNPNSLGLYDMSGNVFEWCFDSIGDPKIRRLYLDFSVLHFENMLDFQVLIQ